MAPGMISNDFLINPPERLPLVLHGLLLGFPNIQATQEGSFLNFLSFLGIILLLDIMIRDLKEQRFSLWCQTRIALSSCPKSSSVDHRLAMSFLVSSAPTAYFSTSSKLLGIYYGLLVRVRRSSPASRLSSWPKILIF